MRELSTRMLEAVLEGEGLQGVADLAAAEARAAIAIVMPGRGLSAQAPAGHELNGLAEYARARVAGTDVAAPEAVAAEEPVIAGGERVGLVVLLAESDGEGDGPAVDGAEVLRAAALAVIAEVAVADAREEAEREARGSLIQELRARSLPAADATSKAARLGCDLSRGALALVAAITSTRPSHASALVESEYEGSVAELSDGRLTRCCRPGVETTPRSGRSRAPAGSSSGCAATGSPPSRPSIPIPASCIARCARRSWCST